MPSIVLHDDQVGMYLDAEVRALTSDEERTIDKLGLPARTAIEIHYKSDSLVCYCTGLIVPFPNRVMLEGVEATLRAASLIDKDMQAGGFVDRGRDKVLRTFLVRSNTYKESLLYNSHMSRALRSVYRGLPMPRSIWVVEFGYLDEWEGQVAPENLLVHGEFIFDSTSADVYRACLAVHMPSSVTAYDVTLPTRHPKRYHISNDTQGYPTYVCHSGRP
ncbi:hypothetical protein COU79_00860 [Candidatus Peregrinibacteria bacterium CG10_big_fil_rev_8_21_14_0_10_54_7]|nr:MAG: hypothetical protein COU79_00860 [Candidatus Peregrinibacteria bacterium CG10_big_fil_rev_8_21_14_0_10_54_7]